MIYHDFYLTIDEARGDYFPTEAKWDDARAQDELRLDLERLTYVWEKLKEEGTDRKFVTIAGKALYECLFHGAVGELYHECLGQIRKNSNEGIRLRLTVRPAELADVPWEILYDGRDFLAISTKTPLTRYIELRAPIYEFETDSIKVLIVIPEWSGLGSDEKTKVINALQSLGSRVQIEVLDTKVTRRKIRTALHGDPEKKYQVFHFIGHAAQDDALRDCLVLDSEVDGKPDFITAQAFSLFFMDYYHMKLVVLNSCNGAKLPSSEPSSGMAPQLIDEQIPAVIAMQYEIEDKVATLFAEEFYTRLTKGDDKGRVEACVSYARRVICQEYDSTNEFIIPVLFSRSRADVLFNLESKSKKLQSVQEVHVADSVLLTQKSNIEIFSEQAKNAPAEDAERANERLAKEIEAAKLTRKKIKKWRQRVMFQSAAVFLLVIAACWVGLFGPLNLDDYIERRFISFMDSHVQKPFSPKVRVIGVKEGDNGTFGSLNLESAESRIAWRKNYAKLITDLAHPVNPEHKPPRVIALDIEFIASANPSQAEVEANKTLIDAVNKAEEENVRVIAAIDTSQTETLLLKTSLAQMGYINNLRFHTKSKLVREVTLAAPEKAISSSGCAEREVAVLPSFPLLAVMQFENNTVACLNEAEDQITLRDSSETLVKGIPVFTEYSISGITPMMSKTDLAGSVQLNQITETIEEAYSDSKTLRDPASYQDGIVIIGVFRTGEPNDEKDIWLGSDSEGEPRKGKRYGPEIQANVVSNLLTGTYIYPVPITWDFLLILLMIALGVLLEKAVRTWPALAFSIKRPEPKTPIEFPWILLVVPVVYFLIAFVAYKEWRLLLPANAAYHLLALVITYYTTRFARTKAGLR